MTMYEYENTGQPAKDAVYNWIVNRYETNGKEWNTSDTIVWKGAVYEMPTIIGYILQMLLFWWLAMLAIRTRGDGDAIFGVIFLMIILLFRMTILSNQLRSIKNALEKVR